MAGRPDEAGDELVGRPVVEVARGVHLLQDAVLEHRHPVAHGHRLDLVVGDVDRRRPEPALQRGDLRAGLHAELRVEVRQRLVHQEDLRLAHDRPAHRDPLPLPARERLGLAVQVLLEVEQLRRLAHPHEALLLGHAGDLQREAHVVARPSCAGTARSSGTPSRCPGPWAAGGSRPASPIRIDPSVTSSSPASIRSEVDLPQPDGPDEDEELAVVDRQVERVDRRSGRARVDERGPVVGDGGHGIPSAPVQSAPTLTRPRLPAPAPDRSGTRPCREP